MDIVIILIAIPALLILGIILSQLSDWLWFKWVDIMLWWAQKRSPVSNLPNTTPVPKETLPLPPEAKRKEELDALDINDPTFIETFRTWLTNAVEENQNRTDPAVPRFQRERQEP